MRRVLTIIGGIILLALIGLTGYSQFYFAGLNEKYGPIGSMVEVDGAQLHYVERLPDPGSTSLSGKTVVLIHGASANLRDQLTALANPLAIRGHRVIAFDRPGHGYSKRGPSDAWKPEVQARMIHDALEKIGVEDPVIVGHSWGGAVTAAYLTNYSGDVAGGVILAGATHPWDGGPSWYNAAATTPLLGFVLRQCCVALLGQALIPPGVEANFAPNKPVVNYAERAGIPLVLRPSTFYANAQDMVKLNKEVGGFNSRYGEITAPLTIVHGTDDASVSYRIHAEPLHAQVPHSELILLESTGHMLHYSRTADVVGAIARMVEGPSPHAE